MRKVRDHPPVFMQRFKMVKINREKKKSLSRGEMFNSVSIFPIGFVNPSTLFTIIAQKEKKKNFYTRLV